MLGLATDAISIPLARLNQASRTYERFRAVWGTMNINGVEVHAPGLPFYFNDTFVIGTAMKRFLLALGISEEEFTAQKIDDDVEVMIFKLNPLYVWDGSTRPGGTPETPDAPYDGVTLEQIRDAINNSMTIGDELVVTVAYGGDTKRYVEQHSIEWTATGTDVVSGPFNSSEVRAVLHSQPWFYFANIRDDGDIDSTVQWQTINQGTNDVPLDRIEGAGVNRVLSNAPVCDVACDKSVWGIFALMEDTQVFEPIGTVYGDRISTVDMGLEGQALRYEYKLKYRFKGCTLTSKIVNELYARYHQVMLANSELGNSKLAQDKANGAIDTKYKKAMVDLKGSNVTNSLYYGGLLRADAASKMKRTDFLAMLAKNLDTDYTIKAADSSEKIMAIVIVIIAVVITVLSYGALSEVGYGMAAAAAGALSAGGLALTLGSMLLANFGGMSAQGLVNRIGTLAEYFGYASMIAGIFAIVQGAWQQASGKLAAEQAAKESAMQASEGVVVSAVEEVSTAQILGQMAIDAVNNVVSSVTGFVDNFVNSATNLGSMQLTDVVSMVRKGIDMASTAMKMYQDKEAKALNAEYEALDAEKRQYEADSSNAMRDPLAVLTYVQDYCSAYDGITALRVSTDNKIGQGTFNAWNAERAAI